MADIFGNDRPQKMEDNSEEVWRSADAALLHDAIGASLRRGWLVSFGRSRDGGAVSLSVLDDGERSRAWCGEPAELESALQRLLSAATDQDAAPTVKPKAKRQKRK